MNVEPERAAALHREFARTSNGEADGLRAATAVIRALSMDGAFLDGAKAVVAFHGADPHRLVRDVEALAIARYAREWLFLISMYGSRDGVALEMTGYLQAFLPSLLTSLEQLADRSVNLLPAGDDTDDWGAALGLFGSIWLEGRRQGLSDEAATQALWRVR